MMIRIQIKIDDVHHTVPSHPGTVREAETSRSSRIQIKIVMLMIQYVYVQYNDELVLVVFLYDNSIAKSATRTTFWFVVGFCCDFPKRAPRGGARQINVIILKFLKKTKAAPELLSPELKNILSTVARTVPYGFVLYGPPFFLIIINKLYKENIR